ncbi:hypothetical protein ARMSODRAFT_1081578 [Armillaria solidipes]|uniref:RNI-like protein n=1 Tax=Armillaria solidipes TaxID=1076256 RepID=A0A2H3CDI1_9AGAR|nr:hypothetical protein ARMSODRAFT_1081578 [Armillaria solidipes]
MSLSLSAAKILKCESKNTGRSSASSEATSYGDVISDMDCRLFSPNNIAMGYRFQGVAERVVIISLVSPNPSGDSNPLTVPSLRSLKFLAPVNHFGNISSLLDRLDMPSLTQLVVECADGTGSYIAPNQDIMRSILGLLERFSCSLTLLRLYDVRMTSYDMRSLFIRLSNLEDLRLANVGNDTITNTVLRELAAIDESLPAFPKLHTFHIDGAWGFKQANLING